MSISKSRQKNYTLSVINWMNCIWESDLPSNSKLIAAYLRSFMNDHHDIAWPSLSKIQAGTGLARNTVWKYIDVLVEAGFLARDKQSRNSTTYIATFPKHIEQAVKKITTSSRDELAEPKGRSRDDLDRSRDDLSLGRESTPNKQIEVNKEINNTSSQSAEIEFEKIPQNLASHCRHIPPEKHQYEFEQFTLHYAERKLTAAQRLKHWRNWDQQYKNIERSKPARKHKVNERKEAALARVLKRYEESQRQKLAS